MSGSSPAVALALLLLVAVLPTAGAAQGPPGAVAGAHDRARDLQRVRDAIAEARKRVAAYESEQRGLLEAVEALDRALAMLAADVSQARKEADAARTSLAVLEAEAGDLTARLDETRRAMSARAVALYQAGDMGTLRLLFSSGGLREFLSRVQGLRRLLHHDTKLLARYRGQSLALVEARAQAGEAAQRLEESAARLRQRSAELAGERAVKRRLVSRLGADRSRERAALRELETAARALEETLEDLRSEPGDARIPAGPPFASLQERLEAPVDADVVSEFGRVVDAEFRTETFRNGVEFDAPRGTPVFAVAAGRVRFAGWFRGYGKLVILDHGDQYFTVLGHLDELHVQPGDAVEARASVGTVGDTGSLAGARLYFEIRRAAEPLDPRDWIGSLESR